MKKGNLIAVAAAILVSATCCRSQCIGGTGGKTGTLRILPVDRSKTLATQDDYVVKEFMDLRSNTDQSRLFGRRKETVHGGGPYYADHVPFGRYRIKLQSKSGGDSFGRLIDVCEPDEDVEVPNKFGRVHIVPMLSGLRSVKPDSVDMVEVGKFQNTYDHTEMSDLFKAGVADQIPYGRYELEYVSTVGAIEREVDVFQADVWIFSDGVEFDGIEAYSVPSNIVRGEIKNIPENEKPVFMIMSGVYIPYTINSVVTDAGNGSGTFSFVGKNPRAVYMLCTIGKSGILDARVFSLEGDSNVKSDPLNPSSLDPVIIVDLSHPSPPKIHGTP